MLQAVLKLAFLPPQDLRQRIKLQFGFYCNSKTWMSDCGDSALTGSETPSVHAVNVVSQAVLRLHYALAPGLQYVKLTSMPEAC